MIDYWCSQLNNLIYADYKILLVDKERKLQGVTQKIVKKSEKKEPNINCNKTEYIVDSERKRQTCQLQIRGTEIKQVHKYKDLRSKINTSKK